MYHSNMLNVQQTLEIIKKFNLTVEKEIIDSKMEIQEFLAQKIEVMIKMCHHSIDLQWMAMPYFPMIYLLHQNQI